MLIWSQVIHVEICWYSLIVYGISGVISIWVISRLVLLLSLQYDLQSLRLGLDLNHSSLENLRTQLLIHDLLLVWLERVLWGVLGCPAYCFYFLDFSSCSIYLRIWIIRVWLLNAIVTRAVLTLVFLRFIFLRVFGWCIQRTFLIFQSLLPLQCFKLHHFELFEFFIVSLEPVNFLLWILAALLLIIIFMQSHRNIYDTKQDGSSSEDEKHVILALIFLFVLVAGADIFSVVAILSYIQNLIDITSKDTIIILIVWHGGFLNVSTLNWEPLVLIFRASGVLAIKSLRIRLWRLPVIRTDWILFVSKVRLESTIIDVMIPPKKLFKCRNIRIILLVGNNIYKKIKMSIL